MISVDEARRRILAAFEPLPPETISVADGLGRVLATDVIARVTQPPGSVSAMDGYAVRAADVADVPATLRVVAQIPAGVVSDCLIGPGEAARIFTGAQLPAGADAIVIQEDTDSDGDHVVVREVSAIGRYVRHAGLDFRQGQVGLARGKLLTARDVGLAAAMNVPWLSVHRRPRVAILATGNEIVLPGEPIGPGQIVSSNSFALGASVIACGAAPIHLPVALDDRDSLLRAADAAAGADLLVTSGGASVGEHDLVRTVFTERGLSLDFWKIAMRPGKPLMFGRMQNVPVIGLPGNPVSAFVCALLFIRPALLVMSGIGSAEPARSTARLSCDLPENDRREDYLRASLTRDCGGNLIATPFPRQDSSMMSLLANADCLVIRPPHAPPARVGDLVEIVSFEAGVFRL